MGIFGPAPFEVEIDKATSVNSVIEDWSLILEVCDKVNLQPSSSKDCLKAILKRMSHSDPHIVIKAITLLDACVNNCGKPFHLEIASREFETEFRRILSRNQEKGVSQKLRQILKQWAEGDFKDDPQLNLIPSLYMKLREEGVDFSNLNDKPTKSAAAAKAAAEALKDPNVVSTQQEQDDIAKAIELSLKEVKNSPKHTASATTTSSSAAYPSLYPSFTSGSNATPTQTTQSSANQPEPRKVRASYDFEAAEDNELTFYTGEIIHVLDDSDPNWWRGYNQRGEGLFPSNFVTADLNASAEADKAAEEAAAAKQEQQEKTDAAAAAMANQRIEIDEIKIDRLLHLLHEANPEDPSQDTEEMLNLENEVHQMGPLIDAELERVDQKHAQLSQLSSDLVDAMNLYHTLMRENVGLSAPYMGVGMPMGGMGPRNMMGYGGPMPTGNPHMMYAMNGLSGSQSLGAMPQPSSAYGPAGMASLPYNGGSMPMPMPNQPQGGPVPMQYQNGHVNTVLPPGMMPPHQPGLTPDQQLKHQHQQLVAPNPATTQQHQQQTPATALHVISPQHQPMPYGHPPQQQQPPLSNHQPPHMNMPPLSQGPPQQAPIQGQAPQPSQLLHQPQLQQQPHLQQGPMPPYSNGGGNPNQMPAYAMQPTSQQQQPQPLTQLQQNQSIQPQQQQQNNQLPPHPHQQQMNQITAAGQAPSNDILANLQTQMAGMSVAGAPHLSQGIPPMPMAMGGHGMHAGSMMGGLATGSPYAHAGFAEQQTDIPIYQQQR